MSSGIYAIIRKADQEVLYIGQAKDLLKRQKEHQYDLLKRQHGNHLLQEAIDLLGVDGIEFVVLQEVQDVKKLNMYELLMITHHNPHCNLTGGNLAGIRREDYPEFRAIARRLYDERQAKLSQ